MPKERSYPIWMVATLKIESPDFIKVFICDDENQARRLFNVEDIPEQSKWLITANSDVQIELREVYPAAHDPELRDQLRSIRQIWAEVAWFVQRHSWLAKLDATYIGGVRSKQDLVKILPPGRQRIVNLKLPEEGG